MIAAERTVPFPRERVFAFLAHLPNHWLLDKSMAAVDATGEKTAIIELRGPLGISRHAHTSVLEAVEPSRLRGRAEVGGTVAAVVWDLGERGGGTHVRLSSEIERATTRDRLLLLLGGSWWVRHVYRRALANLEKTLAKEAT